MTHRLREIGGGLAATAVLLALAAGPPVLLAAAVGWPLPRKAPTWAEVADALGGSTVSDAALVKALACASWFVWLLVVASIVEELVALARGRAARRIPGGGPLQPLVRQLVMTATLVVAAARSVASPMTLPAAIPAVAVAHETTAPAASEVTPTAPALPNCLVQPRDSLWKLAENHLGDGMRWRELWELNHDRAQADGRVFNDPNLIHPGWQLTMPADAVGLVAPAAMPEAPPPLPPPPPPTTTALPPTEPTSPALTTPASQPAHHTGPEGDVGPAPSEADDPDFEVVPLLAGAALVAAGIVTSLDRLRRRQVRHRPPGRSIRMPKVAERGVEVSLRRAADTRTYTRLDLALRNLGHQLAAAGEGPAPRVDVVSVGPAGVEILLDRASDAPGGPFEVTAEGRAWTLPAEVDDSVLSAVAHDTAGPVPALVAIGTVDDRTVLIDLESAPCTVLNGDPTDARSLLWTIALDLATSDRADDIDLLVVGDVPQGLDALDRVRRAARITDVLDDIERHVRSTKELLAADGHETAFDARLAGQGDGMTPTVVVIDAPVKTESLERLILLARLRAGLAVVMTGDLQSPDRELCVEEDTLILKPLGLRLRPAALPEDVVSAAAALVATAVDLDGSTRRLEPVADPSSPGHDFVVEYDKDGAPVISDGHVLVRIFGGVEVIGGARPIDRRRCIELVVYLALHPDGVDEERLREALWPEDNPTRSAFNETVSRARRCLGLDPTGLPHVRPVEHGRYRLGPFVHVERLSGGSAGRANGANSVPFQGCRGYEWAYTEGIAYALEAPAEVASRTG